MTPFAKLCELAALGCEALKALTNGTKYVVESKQELSVIASRMRALAEEEAQAPAEAMLRLTDLPKHHCSVGRVTARSSGLELTQTDSDGADSPMATGCTVGGCENAPDECSRCAASEPTSEPCSCEEAEQLRRKLQLELESVNTLREQLDSARAEVERLKQESAGASTDIRNALTIERKMVDDQRTEIAQLKQQLAAAQYRLPELARRTIGYVLDWARADHFSHEEADALSALGDLNIAELVDLLGPTQRRQYEEP